MMQFDAVVLVLLTLFGGSLSAIRINDEQAGTHVFIDRETNNTLSGECRNNQVDLVYTNISQTCNHAADSSPESLAAVSGVIHNDNIYTLGKTVGFQTYYIGCTPDRSECVTVIMYGMTVQYSLNSNSSLDCVLEYTYDNKRNDNSKPTLPTSVQWLKNGEIITTRTVEIANINFNDDADVASINDTLNLASRTPQGGRYECRFVLSILSPKQEQQLARHIDVPRSLVTELSFSPEQEQYKDGDAVTIMCKVTGHPIPEITIKHGNEEARCLNGLQNKISSDSTIFSCTLSDLEDSIDRGNYECMNGDKKLADKLLRIRDRLAPLWPFIGILAQVIVLILCILIGEKIRRKKISEKLRKNDPGPSQPSTSN